MLVYKLLNHLQRLSLQVNGLLRHNLLNLSQEIGFHVLVSVVLKDIARQFNSCETLSMDEMAKVSTGTSNWTMVIPTRHCTIVTWLYQLVWVQRLCGFCRGWRLTWLRLNSLCVLDSIVRHVRLLGGAWWLLMHGIDLLLLTYGHLVLLSKSSLNFLDFVCLFEIFNFFLRE
jgi:hypothetical protein